MNPNPKVAAEDELQRYERESKQLNQPIEVVKIKRDAAHMFHEDHADGDLAIYQVVHEMLAWHNQQVITLLQELHRTSGEGLPKRDYDNETDEAIDEVMKQYQV